MPQRSRLRASDADREQIVERLRKAAAEGRLFSEELEQRLVRALRARTYGELDAVVADLPATRRRASPVPWRRAAMVLAVAALTVVVLAVAAVIITGVLATWMLWVALGWFFFGRRRHRCGGRKTRRGALYGRSAF